MPVIKFDLEGKPDEEVNKLWDRLMAERRQITKKDSKIELTNMEALRKLKSGTQVRIITPPVILENARTGEQSENSLLEGTITRKQGQYLFVELQPGTEIGIDCSKYEKGHGIQIIN